MVEESTLPGPFQLAIAHLRSRRVKEVRVDAVADNFAYVWVEDLEKASNEQPQGGWLRLPTGFPHVNPHGLITREPLKLLNGSNNSDGHNPGHDMCNPVRDKGATQYYSWTWQDCPQIRCPEDILGVVQWYERRIRKG
jgi:hypothetical protein